MAKKVNYLPVTSNFLQYTIHFNTVSKINLSNIFSFLGPPKHTKADTIHPLKKNRRI